MERSGDLVRRARHLGLDDDEYTFANRDPGHGFDKLVADSKRAVRFERCVVERPPDAGDVNSPSGSQSRDKRQGLTGFSVHFHRALTIAAQDRGDTSGDMDLDNSAPGSATDGPVAHLVIETPSVNTKHQDPVDALCVDPGQHYQAILPPARSSRVSLCRPAEAA